MKQHANRKLAKAAHFDVDVRHGLTDSQVEARLNEGLVNKTKKKVTKSYGRIIFDNLVLLVTDIQHISLQAHTTRFKTKFMRKTEAMFRIAINTIDWNILGQIITVSYTC